MHFNWVSDDGMIKTLNENTAVVALKSNKEIQSNLFRKFFHIYII